MDLGRVGRMNGSEAENGEGVLSQAPLPGCGGPSQAGLAGALGLTTGLLVETLLLIIRSNMPKPLEERCDWDGGPNSPRPQSGRPHSSHLSHRTLHSLP
jgi:hypothetical protein